MPKELENHKTSIIVDELLSEWDYEANKDFGDVTILPSSNKKVWWIKNCIPNNPHGIHRWQASTTNRLNGTGCPTCAGKKILIGFNDLGTTYPELAEEWHPTKNGTLTPQQVSKGSDKKVFWLGTCGHEWDALIRSRARFNLKKSCPYCSGARVLVGFNDFATTRPELVYLWSNKNPVPPSTVATNSHKIFLWNCKLNHEWEAPVSAISKSSQEGCPTCSGHRVLVGFNDLETNYPEIAKQWNYDKNSLKPNEISKSSGKKFWWKCILNHEWEASPNTRINPHTGCPICSNKILLKGFNDLASTHPKLAKEWSAKNILKADEVVAGGMKYFLWECSSKHEWRANIGSRKRGNVCPTCNHKTSAPEKLLRAACQKVLKHMNLDQTEYIKISPEAKAKQYDVIGITMSNEKIIIEYDGWYWHKEKFEKDERMTKQALNAGYKVVRLREASGNRNLEYLSIQHANLFQLSCDTIRFTEDADKVVGIIKDWLDTANNGAEN